MENRKNIERLEDVKLLVDSFYSKVREDKLLGPVFDDVIQDRWPEHLEKMYAFWQTVLLQEHTYQGSPFVPHADLPVHAEHFNKWLELFFETVDEHFEGGVSRDAKWRANKMAQMFHMKIQYYQENPLKTML